MELEKGFKPAMVTTELAVGIGLAVVALFLALALFYQPVSEIISNSNFKNMFNDNTDKTGYVNLNRNYTDSQVDVQLTGAQGLELLRKKANNKAINVIEENFSNSNPDGSSIAYLATAIAAISGEPHICVPMTKDSSQHCDEDNIGGYNYKIALSSTAIAITRISDSQTIYLSLTDPATTLSSELSTIESALDTAGHPTTTVKEQYNTIVSITKAVISVIRSDVVLINLFNTYENDSITSATFETSKNALTQLFNGTILNNLQANYKACKAFAGGARNQLAVDNGCVYRVTILGSENDIADYTTWEITLINNISNATSTNELQEIINTALSNTSILTIIRKDDYQKDGHTPTATLLKNTLKTINSQYGLSITIPDIKPTYEATSIVEDLTQMASDTATAVSNIASDVKDEAVSVAEAAASDVKEAATATADAVKSAASSVASTGKKAINKLKSLF